MVRDRSAMLRYRSDTPRLLKSIKQTRQLDSLIQIDHTDKLHMARARSAILLYKSDTPRLLKSI